MTQSAFRRYTKQTAPIWRAYPEELQALKAEHARSGEARKFNAWLSEVFLLGLRAWQQQQRKEHNAKP